MMSEVSHPNIDRRSDREKEMSGQEGDDTADDIMEVCFVVVGKKNRNNAKLLEALKVYSNKENIIFSDTGMEHMHGSVSGMDDDKDDGGRSLEDQPLFVLDNFEGNIYQSLHGARCRIMGPPAIMHYAASKENLPCCRRPLYCMLMHKVVICSTGHKNKDDVARLAELTHHMGGSIRKEFSSRVTHLVANCAGGEKYRVAVSMGVPLMTVDWVHEAWVLRDRYDTHVDRIEELKKYKMSPFFFCILAFLGFTKEEQREMEETTVQYGGSVVEAGAPQSTHLVVNEHTTKTLPFDTSRSRLHAVKTDWFWASVQMEACADEKMYRFESPSSNTPQLHHSLRDTPSSSGNRLSAGGKSRKRKRLRENLAQLAHEGELDVATPQYKRYSTSGAAANGAGGEQHNTQISISASFLDDTRSPEPNSIRVAASPDQGDNSPTIVAPTPAATEPVSARQQTLLEFLQTEKNYTAILHTIIKLFKEEIENSEQPGGPLLDPTDVKIIFGKIPPLYEIHCRIRDELTDMMANWNEEQLAGNIILKHADALMKSYPPFINFFEDTTSTLERRMKSNPRFFAYLKVCQNKPECGRQPLKELLIRPVQRLASITLLLRDIMKRTDNNHPDHECLSRAVKSLDEVMTHINEDKRKVEGHQVMFDIVNDIENCPPNLLSSHRKFIAKIDVLELTGELSHRGESVSLFIFSDSLEMCKRRVKVLHAKSPGGTAKTPQKAYKHLNVVQLSCIKRVLDIMETPECKNVFALVTKKMGEVEKLFAFVIEDETEKSSVLDKLCRAICDVTCRTDYEIDVCDKATLQATVDATTLNLDTTDLGNKTLGKVATRFGKRVSRAFSFNKTPRKLKRAMSSMTQMMTSPFPRRESGIFAPPPAASSGNGTPGRAGTMAHNSRLGSVQDLTMDDRENMYSELVDSVSLGRTPRMSRRLLSNADTDNSTLQYGPTSCKKRRASLTPMLTSTPSWQPMMQHQEEEEEEEDSFSIYHSPPHQQHSFFAQDNVELDEVSIHSNFSEASAVTLPVHLGRGTEKRRDMLTEEEESASPSLPARAPSTPLTPRSATLIECNKRSSNTPKSKLH